MAEQKQAVVEPTASTWPKSLILDQAYAMAFACVKCTGVPRKCMNNDNGQILCELCASNIGEGTANKTVQNIIDTLKIKCDSILHNEQANNEENEGSNIIATRINDECDWTGSIIEHSQHQTECEYMMIVCQTCNKYQCQRRSMAKHIDNCPEVSIECPLACGSTVLRKNVDNHKQNDCAEYLLNCSNDDCKMQIKRKQFKNHVENECETRIVCCNHAKYGCKIAVKANELQQHMAQYKVEHISNKFDFISNAQNEKIDEMKSQIDDLTKQNKALSAAMIPRGTIVAFSGTVCPKGWIFCDGSNGTPNLCGKFIYGWSNNKNGGAISNNHGKTGGAESHTLTLNEIPSHNHDVKVWRTDDSCSLSKGGGHFPLCLSNHGSVFGPCSGGSYIKEENKGGGQSHNNMPPYCVLAYIMKL